MPESRIVYLVGFMGSGKTTVGRRLASRLQWKFIDLDRLIEERTSMTIAAIFREYGEARFREIESEALNTIQGGSGTVVATGGGAPCRGDNMDHMLREGLAIYLKMSPAALSSRLENARDERPLIKGLKGDELTAFIAEKLREREKWYARAQVTADGLSPDTELLAGVVRDYFV
jgi:shikimate kinase